MKTVSLKLPEALVAKLDRQSQQQGMSQSEVVRAALEQFLSGARTKPLSALDLAGDLVGCAEGPSDLSTSTEHLKGYGQ